MDLSPDLLVTRGELENLIEEKVVRLPKGSEITENGIYLTLDGDVYSPNKDLLTLNYLSGALYRWERERINELRSIGRTNEIKVPAQGGILAISLPNI